MSDAPSVTITHVSDYRFMVDFGAAIPQLAVDENEPIGHGEGPYPEQLLIASVANCLSASLFFALSKFRQDAQGITTRATCSIERNENKRLRITEIQVAITLGTDASQLEHMDRILSQFENFCTVSESVKIGIPVRVSVSDRSGTQLKTG